MFGDLGPGADQARNRDCIDRGLHALARFVCGRCLEGAERPGRLREDLATELLLDFPGEGFQIALPRFPLPARLHEGRRAPFAHEEHVAALVADQGRHDVDHRSPALIHLVTTGGS